MAIAYDNNLYTYIINPLEDLIQAEFGGKINYDEHKGTRSIVIKTDGDELVDLRSGGQIRDYLIQIIYTVKKGGEYVKAKQLREVTEYAERMRRLIWNNSNYSAGGTDYWFNGRVSDIDYSRDEDDPELTIATLDCAFTREEVI